MPQYPFGMTRMVLPTVWRIRPKIPLTVGNVLEDVKNGSAFIAVVAQP